MRRRCPPREWPPPRARAAARRDGAPHLSWRAHRGRSATDACGRARRRETWRSPGGPRRPPSCPAHAARRASPRRPSGRPRGRRRRGDPGVGPDQRGGDLVRGGAALERDGERALVRDSDVAERAERSRRRERIASAPLHGRCARQVVAEAPHKARLPGSRLAADEHEPSAAGTGLRVRGVELRQQLVALEQVPAAGRRRDRHPRIVRGAAGFEQSVRSRPGGEGRPAEASAVRRRGPARPAALDAREPGGAGRA